MKPLLEYHQNLVRLRAQDPERWSDGIIVCDCDLGILERAVAEAGIKNPDRFFVHLFLEAMLMAGVHAFDPQFYERYTRTLGYRIVIEAHGWGGVHRPHILLACVRKWTPARCRELGSMMASLLPVWVEAYDALTGRSFGAGILDSLSRDPDLARSPYDRLSAQVMATIQEGLAQAARGHSA